MSTEPKELTALYFTLMSCGDGGTIDVATVQRLIRASITKLDPSSALADGYTREREENKQNAVKGLLRVRYTPHAREYKARYFDPNTKPWPTRVVQTSRNGELDEDMYYIFINGYTSGRNFDRIYPGDLIVMDDMENVLFVYPKHHREHFGGTLEVLE